MMDIIFGTIAVLFFLAILIFGVYLYVRILHKAGYSGWWVLLAIIPLVNVIMIWIFAFADWPNLRKNVKLITANSESGVSS